MAPPFRPHRRSGTRSYVHFPYPNCQSQQIFIHIHLLRAEIGRPVTFFGFWFFQVDLVGGYYDAGDNVKFGLPMAFTITMLSWGVIEYGEQIAGAGEYHHALEAIKWGTDYFIKAHTHPNVLWAEVIQISNTTYKFRTSQSTRASLSRVGYYLHTHSPENRF